MFLIVLFVFFAKLNSFAQPADAQPAVPAEAAAPVDPPTNSTIETTTEDSAIIQEPQEYDPGTVTGQANAVIKGTQEGSKVEGEVVFWDTKDGLIVEGDFSGIPTPGKHGFHVHEKGSCEDEGKAAGGHYNPMGAPHGMLEKDGMQKAHGGDMGNIEVDDEGYATYDGFLPGIHLKGEGHVVTGLAVIVHEKVDDFGQPTGNAGGRIGCGIIQVVEEPTEEPNE
ncbi:MAG: hypothetical protein A2Z88_00430 [Omnitrophica WOR_2 bacterium GWA2_47_8]|nr:MAG: hypothetical protein A2Z88_00430 [Omnitrophica WOR_2 bacterium GWA2_47_8]